MTPALALSLLVGGWNSRPWCEQRAPLVSRIELREGFQRAGTLPERYHNPGALKFANQPGASLGLHNFARFDSVEEGYVALESLIEKYRTLGRNFRKGWPYLRRNPDDRTSRHSSFNGH